MAVRSGFAEIGAQLSRRRAEAAEAWQLTEELVLIGAGEPIPIPGRADLTYPYRAHSEYYYLTDRNRPGGVLAFDPQEGWFDFVLPVTDDERVWTGVADGEPGGLSTAALPSWLESRTGRPIAWLGTPPAAASSDPELTAELRFRLSDVRVVKDDVELERMRAADRATTAGFAAVVAMLNEGTSEREAQIELEAAAFRHGGDAMAYETIVASGTNSAVLHFPPGARRFRSGELVLIDAGAEYSLYASDVTRTYPVGGQLSSLQRELHALVRAAQLAAVEGCRLGTEWRDVHLTAARVIAEGLVVFGALRGEPEALVETGAVSLFFPHGIGHLVGLGVRDAGEGLRRRGDSPPVQNLRIDLALRAGMVVTVEPGIYFIPALLQDPERRDRHRDEVDWALVDRMLDFGGIRIEDDVLVTDQGPEVMTTDVPLLD